MPLILQTEAAECGLACLAMVAAHHGLRTDLPTLRQRFSLSLKGATMADLARMAGQLQLNPRALRAEMEHLPQLQLPCVLHWDLNHFVVLKPSCGAACAVIHDPARGVRHLHARRGVASTSPASCSSCTPAADFKPRIERQACQLAAAARARDGAQALAAADLRAGAGARSVHAAVAVLHAVGGRRRAGQRRPRPAGHARARLRAAGADPGGDRRDPLVGGAVPVGHAEPAVAVATCSRT